MLTTRLRNLASIGISAVCLFPLSASADIQWNFHETTSPACSQTNDVNGPTVNCSGTGTYFASRTYNASAAGDAGPSVTVSAWANTVGDANEMVERGEVNYWSGGLGARNADDGAGGDIETTSSGGHSIDNENRFDMILFDFGVANKIQLTGSSFGWDMDEDFTLIAYTGGSAGYNPYASSGMESIEYHAGGTNLASQGWTVVGNYDAGGDGDQDFNGGTNGVSSSYWLISAYNPAAGGDCPTGYCNFPDYTDGFKIDGVAGKLTTFEEPPPPGVPVPAPLFLMAFGLLSLHRFHRARVA